MFIELPPAKGMKFGEIINLNLVTGIIPIDFEYPDKPPESKLKDTYRIEFYSLPGTSFDGSYGESHPVLMKTLDFDTKDERDGVLVNIKNSANVQNIDY